MATILLTGSGGFLGSALLKELSQKHQVVTIGRTKPENPTTSIHHTGCFRDLEFLQQLNRYKFDTLIHLAAVTGGCSEQDGIEVNVEGTRRLLQYVSQRGCNKAVLASSIAVVGIQSTEFRPLEIPISDEHPCLDKDG
jgi:UDP-glucose 4-epimerase